MGHSITFSLKGTWKGSCPLQGSSPPQPSQRACLWQSLYVWCILVTLSHSDQLRGLALARGLQHRHAPHLNRDV